MSKEAFEEMYKIVELCDKVPVVQDALDSVSSYNHIAALLSVILQKHSSDYIPLQRNILEQMVTLLHGTATRNVQLVQEIIKRFESEGSEVGRHYKPK